MKLLYCSDLHGNETHYQRLVTLAGSQRPDVIILGGDLLPDDSALDPARMGHDQPQFVRRQFKESVSALRKACRPRAVLVVSGNHDWASSASAMLELAGQELVAVLDHKNVLEIDGVGFLGYPYTPPTPWFVKDFERLDMPDDRPPLLGGARWDQRFSRATSHSAKMLFEGHETIAEELAALNAPAGPWVFVAHAPPYETNLDRTYNGKPLGSRAIRAAIEKHQPMLSLHGHVHESPAVTGEYRHDIRNTVAINPGQTRARLNYAVIQVDVSERTGSGSARPRGEVSQVQHGQQS